MATIDVSNGFPGKSNKYAYTATGAQDWIVGIQPPFSVALFPAGGTSKVEYTFDTRENLATTTDILTWPDGAIASGTQNALFSHVTAIRCNVVAGTCTMYIAGMVK